MQEEFIPILPWTGDLPHISTPSQHLHLADGDLIKPDKPVALSKVHVDELGVHALDVCQYKQLLDGGVVAHVTVQIRVSVTPLFRSLTKERNVQQIGLISVSDFG
jgi:hypothetical protein